MSEVPMQILRRRADPLLTNKPIARARRPIGKSTIQHSATPNATTPDESPQIGGKAVDHTTTTPQTNAGKANTSAAIWNRIPMPLGLFPAGGTKIGSGPFSIISHAFLPANKITADVACIRTRLRDHRSLGREGSITSGASHNPRAATSQACSRKRSSFVHP